MAVCLHKTYWTIAFILFAESLAHTFSTMAVCLLSHKGKVSFLKTPANRFSLWCALNRDRRFLPSRASSWTAAWTAWIRCRPELSRPECGGRIVLLPCNPEKKNQIWFSDYLKQVIDFSFFKTIFFVEARKKKIYETRFCGLS